MNQPLPLVEQLKNLEHLQEIDLKIDSLKKDQSSLPANLRSIDESLTKLRTSLDAKSKQVAELEKAQRQTKAALDLNQDRLSRSSSKLDVVHNSQEFQAATKEIDQLKKLNSSLEDQNKKSEVEFKTLSQEVTSLTEQLQKIQKDRDAQAQTLSGQDNKFKNDIAALVSERSQYVSRVEPRILSQYDRIRSARGGLGVVPAIGGRCKGCNMMVPPQLFNEVQRGTALHSCPSCHRLLFIPSAKAADATNPTRES